MRKGSNAYLGHGAGPELAFSIEGADAVEFAAVPTLRFLLRVESRSGESIRSLTLNTQVRIAAGRRSYGRAEQERLEEVFGTPERWGTTVRSLFWIQTVVQVPPFTGSTVVEVPVACTYDFEITAAKYFHALDEGVVPLEFLFSGTVFYVDDGGSLRAGRVSWESEAEFGLPVRVWKTMMEHYFPNSAWIRLRSDLFDRLHAFKAKNAFPTWDAAVEALLAAGEREGEVSSWTP